MAAEIQTDSETEEESTESLTPAGTSIDSIIQNSDLFDCSPEKQVPKKVPPPPPLTPKTPQVSSGEPPIKRTFGKSANTSQNGNQANSKNKKERPPDFSTDKKVPPPILPKIKRKSPSAKSAAPKLVDPKLTQNLPDKKPTPTVTHPPPPPLKRAPPRDRDQPGTDAKKLKSEKLVKSDAIKVAIEPPTVPNVKKTERKTERKELESKKSDGNTADIKISKSETKASKPDVKKSELQSDIEYARVDKIKVMFRNWIVERQKRQNRTNV